MAGGLLNLISEGNNNIILTGTPTKTFFNVTYSKYTNFGMQKFRLDYEGSRDLRLTEDSVFKFKVKRYAELLMDTYVVVTLPDIWSPIMNPLNKDPSQKWTPYDFKWIRDLGTTMIREITITCGTMTLQKYTGEYLAAQVERDFPTHKRELFNKMTGNVEELHDPAFAHGRSNCYPSAYYSSSAAGAEPSIRGRTLYIPINTWFTLDSRCAFPLVSLQYNELEITVTFRPIQDIFQIRDITDRGNLYPYVRPDFNLNEHQMYRFLQTPPSIFLEPERYANKINTWNADIHLMATYCFLSKDEAQLFAMKDQVYLVKDVMRYDFQNVTGSKRVKLTSSGMVSNWMFYLQRNDVNLRNEWSNYTNWPYRSIPEDIMPAPDTLPPEYQAEALAKYDVINGPRIQPDGGNTGFLSTGAFSVQNQKHILHTMGILLNGEYRENTLTHGIYDYVEKYMRTNGCAKDGLYCYNFCLNTNPFEYQPSGALNMSKFKTIEFEMNTYVPEFDLVNSQVNFICDSQGNPVGVNKQNWRLYEYNYNLTIFEERYNILSFISGQCGMLMAR
jgi:hypothetical protein